MTVYKTKYTENLPSITRHLCQSNYIQSIKENKLRAVHVLTCPKTLWIGEGGGA